jgi:major membrane immunogen (membrane-anchored lipoprotein)
MKKSLLIIFVFMMMVIVTACGKKGYDRENILDVNVDVNYSQDDNNPLADLI